MLGPLPKRVPSDAHSRGLGEVGVCDPRPPCPVYLCSLGVGLRAAVSDGWWEFCGWVCPARVRVRGARRLPCLGLAVVSQAWNVSAGRCERPVCLSLAGACGCRPGTEHVLLSCPAVA